MDRLVHSLDLKEAHIGELMVKLVQHVQRFAGRHCRSVVEMCVVSLPARSDHLKSYAVAMNLLTRTNEIVLGMGTIDVAAGQGAGLYQERRGGA